MKSKTSDARAFLCDKGLGVGVFVNTDTGVCVCLWVGTIFPVTCIVHVSWAVFPLASVTAKRTECVHFSSRNAHGSREVFTCVSFICQINFIRESSGS